MYTLSIIDHIQQVLKNPNLCSRMYFGPRIEGENRTEFWHGKIWSKSPLFSNDTLKVTSLSIIIIYCILYQLHMDRKMHFLDQVTRTYRTGNFISYADQQNHLQIGFLQAFVQVNENLQVKVQQLWKYSMIPAHLHSAERLLKSHRGCLWLADEQFVIMPTTQIRDQVKVWLMDQPEPEEQEHFVDEIVYRHNRLWKMRLIQYRHLHPSETINLPSIPSGL
jgi:hypothetical protein